MIKQTFFIVVILLISFSCSKDCREPMGKIVQEEITVANFNRIVVNSGVEMVIKEGDVCRVVVETGENRLDRVSVEVIDGQLELEAELPCMTSANLDPIKVFVTAPTLTSIRNSSEYCISSDGVLRYTDLVLKIENYNSDYLNIGNFDLKIDNAKLRVVSNGISNVTIQGATDTLVLGYYSGIGRFEGASLRAKDVLISHRGENTLKVNPQESIKGNILSVGDVFSYNHPAVIGVVEHYEGRLVFK